MRHSKHDLIQAEINLMPLIDVCLVLMIILLVVFPMVKAAAAPAAPAEAKPVPSPGVLALEEPRLAVAILADGSLVVDGQPVPHADLQRVLGEIWSLTPNRPVVLKVDRHVRYGQVRFVLQSVYGAGFGSAGLDRR